MEFKFEDRPDVICGEIDFLKFLRFSFPVLVVSLARFCCRKYKKSTACASLSWKNWSRLVGKSSGETACLGYAASCLQQRNQGSRFLLQSEYYYTDIDITNYVTFNNHPRGREERGRQEKRNTACLFCLAPSVTRVVIFVSRAFSLDGLRKKRNCR